jgi:hypothetical protein
MSSIKIHEQIKDAQKIISTMDTSRVDELNLVVMMKNIEKKKIYDKYDEKKKCLSKTYNYNFNKFI